MGDRSFHTAFSEPVRYREPPVRVVCERCGAPLLVYYAENRLYAVKCTRCEKVLLTYAGSPTKAALRMGILSEEVNV